MYRHPPSQPLMYSPRPSPLVVLTREQVVIVAAASDAWAAELDEVRMAIIGPQKRIFPDGVRLAMQRQAVQMADAAFVRMAGKPIFAVLPRVCCAEIPLRRDP